MTDEPPRPAPDEPVPAMAPPPEMIGTWPEETATGGAAASGSASLVQRYLPLGVAALGVVALGVMLALGLGERGAGSGAMVATPAGASAPGAGSPANAKSPAGGDLGVMADRLAKRLHDSPNDPGGWELLARAYANIGKQPEAIDAFKQAFAHGANNPQFFADYAEALAIAAGGRLAGEPMTFVARALKIDPKHPKALELAASAAFQAKDYKLAVRHWETLMGTYPPQSPEAVNLRKQIVEAKALASGKAAPAPASGAPSKDKAAAAPAPGSTTAPAPASTTAPAPASTTAPAPASTAAPKAATKEAPKAAP